MNISNISKLLITISMLTFNIASYASVKEFSAADKSSFSGTRTAVIETEKNTLEASFNSFIRLAKLDQNSHEEKIKKESKKSEQYPAVASPVPEPETYAMILIGLVLIGITTRRRNFDV